MAPGPIATAGPKTGASTLYAARVNRRARVILTAIGCVLLGAIGTWGVAWGIALWADPPSVNDPGGSMDAIPWPQGVPVAWEEPLACASCRDRLQSSLRCWATGADGEEEAWQARFGWPCRAMELRVITATPFTALNPSGSTVLASTAAGPWAWLRPAAASRGVPTTILSGFAVNSLMTAAVLFAACEGVRLWKLRAWVLNGRCPACGYDRRGLKTPEAACPECGGVLT